MKNIEQLKRVIRTLLCSWGGDTPSEAIWTLNKLIKLLNMEYSTNISTDFPEEWDDDDFDNLMNSLEQLTAK